MLNLNVCLAWQFCPKWGNCDLKFKDFQSCKEQPKEELLEVRTGNIDDGVCKYCAKKPNCAWMMRCKQNGYCVTRCRMWEEQLGFGASDGLPKTVEAYHLPT